MTLRNTIQSVTFTAEDLEYNRRGELSPRQRARAREENAGCMTMLGVAIGASALAIVAALAFGGDELTGLAAVAAALGILALLTLGSIVRYDRQPIKTARGTFEHVVDRSMVYTYRHNVVIGGTPFRTDHIIPRDFAPGAIYAVYYRGNQPKYILSYEKLEDAPEAAP